MAKSKLLKEIEFTKYSQLPLLEYQYAPATVIDSIATIKSTNFSKFEQFSNVTVEITSEIISSFQESNLLVNIPDRCNFELTIKSAERLRHTKKSV